MFHPPEACHIFFSYSLQMVEIGSSSCTTPMFFQTPWLSYFQNWKSAGRREQSHNLRIWYRVGWKYSVCALQFVVVYRDNVKDVVSVHRVVWAINFVTLYRGLTVLNPNIISSLRLLLHRVNKKSLWPDPYSKNSMYSNNSHTIDVLTMAFIEYIRNVDRAILNTVFENTVRRVNKCL